MRISHVITSLATGGAETLVVDLSLKLAELGHDVEIVTLSDAHGVPRQTALRSGIRVRDLGHDPRDPRSIGRLRRAVAASDIMHVHLFPTLYVGAIARIRQPRVYTEHSTFNRRRANASLTVVERAMYRRYSHLIAISDGVGAELERYLSRLSVDKPVTVIPNGIGDAFFENRTGPRSLPLAPLRLIAIGSLDDRKNFSTAISGVALVPDVSLDIVGSGALESSLRAQIDRLGVADRVHLLGRRDDIPHLLDTHDALLSTSRYEGFGLVAAEALARGMPVLGPDVAGFRDVVSDGKTGLLYPQSAEAEAEAEASVASLIARLNESGRYEAFSRNAIATSDRFSIGRVARAHLELYSAELA
jgi:Glycosyltransferase